SIFWILACPALPRMSRNAVSALLLFWSLSMKTIRAEKLNFRNWDAVGKAEPAAACSSGMLNRMENQTPARGMPGYHRQAARNGCSPSGCAHAPYGDEHGSAGYSPAPTRRPPDTERRALGVFK